MLLERNQALIGLIAALVIVAGTVFAVGATSGAFVSGFPMKAEFTDAAGLKSGDFVFVAGVRSGQVTGVHIEGDHVVADFALDSDGVPNDSTASIILQSTLGRRALKLDPGTSTEYFKEGDTITLDRTTTPIDLPELGDRGADLLGNVDVSAMQDIIEALGEVFDGAHDDVANLLDGLQKVSDIIVNRRTELERVIDRAQTLVDAAADQDQDIIRIIDAFSTTLDTLLANRTEITRLLENTSSASNTTADLISERRAQIDDILGQVKDDLAIVDAHQVDIAHIFAYSGVAFEGFASIGYQGGDAKIDNPSWGNVFTTGLGQVGVGALLGCNGTIDRALTAVIGPDPACENSTGNTSGAAAQPTAASTSDPGTPLVDGAGGFFSPAVVLSRMAPPPDVVAASAGVLP